MRHVRNVLQSVSILMLLFVGIFLSASFLLLYRLSDLMNFFGDAGWFYLSARDMLLGKGIPLVSITASHTWLHQGPFWTYMLGLALWLGKFNPVSGAYLAVCIGLATIVSLYVLGRQLFSEKIALIASALSTTSPLALIHARMPYHTMPIPLFSLVYFFAIFKFISGEKRYFPMIFLLLGVLYNFELATVMLAAPLCIVLGYGVRKKTSWIKSLRRKDIGLAILAGLIPMLPVVLYDTTHGFKQTVIYAGWLVYNAFRALGLPFFPHSHVSQSINIFQFTFTLLQRLVFLPNGFIALGILVAAIVFACYMLYQQNEAGKVDKALLLVTLWFVSSIILYLGNKTASEAYVPVFFPAIFFLLANLFAFIIKQQKIGGLFFLILLMGLNVQSLLSHNYLMDEPGGYGVTFAEKETVMRNVLNTVHGGKYQLIGLGKGSQFESFLMPYQYLGWYYGNPPSKGKGRTFIVEEQDTGVTLLQKQGKINHD